MDAHEEAEASVPPGDAPRRPRADAPVGGPAPVGPPAAGPSHGPAVDPREARELERLRGLAYLLDDAFRIPVIGHRFGIDAVMGLVPGIGDVGGFALSAYLIARARSLGVPPRLLARMAAWSTLDLAIGAVPVVGDVADFVLKPNRRALRTLERYLAERAGPPDPDAPMRR